MSLSTSFCLKVVVWGSHFNWVIVDQHFTSKIKMLSVGKQLLIPRALKLAVKREKHAYGNAS